jgi:hypothetical protein
MGVEDVRSRVAELTQRGVKFAKYTFVEDKERGIWRAPGGAQVAWLKDPADGNVLSLAQPG